MTTYAIGDIQGCYDDLVQLLNHSDYDEASDELWIVGDLINRGPKNLETLRFVRQLGDKAKVVLGNHDLHFLAIVFGGHNLMASDTFADVLDSPDCEELSHWMRRLPLLVESVSHVMTHAGIPHIWDLETTREYARTVQKAIASDCYDYFFKNMYGNFPQELSADLDAMDRLRILTNYFTRMRFIAQDGILDFKHKLTLDTAPVGFKAWFEYPSQVSKTIVFGHWAALNGITNREQALATDTGCVWGRGLTAIRLEDRYRFTWRANNLYVQK